DLDAGLHLGLAPGGAPVLRDRYRGAAAGAEEPARQRAVWNFDNSQESAGIVYLRPGEARVGRAVNVSSVTRKYGIGAAEGADRTEREEGGREDLLAHNLDPSAGPAAREVEVVEGPTIYPEGAGGVEGQAVGVNGPVADLLPGEAAPQWERLRP